MASVLFKAGDLLEGGKDLTVLPCSAKGTISRATRHHVDQYGIPMPTPKELGEIEVVEFPGPGSLTRQIAWAASVLNDSSSPDVIERIAERLGEYVVSAPGIHLLECPLLGTGAGRLEPLDSGLSLRRGFRKTCSAEATLVVYAYQTSIVRLLQESVGGSHDRSPSATPLLTEAPDPKVPRVFVSYCWEADSHKKWVLDLATRLRRDGVDVTLDQWHAVPGDQLPAFMESALRANDYVLIICSPKYKLRSDGRVGGVGYEGDIMTAEVATTRNHRKFIPVLRAGKWEEAAPIWLMGKLYLDLTGTSADGYQQLLDTLHGRRPQPPPIGSPSS